MLVLSLSTNADDSGSCGEDVTWTYIESTGTLIISGNGSMNKGNSAYSPWSRYCNEIRKVVIEEGVTNIIPYAFRGCCCLTSISIPNTVTDVGDYAFYGCTSLTSPIYHANIFVYMPTSYRGAYNIPNGITTICGAAFNGCEYLTNIYIPNSVTVIGNNAFSGCTRLTSITIPNSVTDIWSYAFSGCSRLESIIIPNSVNYLDGSAFIGCNSLTGITFLGEYLSLMGKELIGVDNVYVYDGTRTLLALWKSEFKGKIYEIGTGRLLEPITITPTTIRFHQFIPVVGYLRWEEISLDNNDIEKKYVFTGLEPNTKHKVNYSICIGLNSGRYEYVHKGGTIDIHTPYLSFTTLEPKVVSPGNVIVSSESNLDDIETNIGFEWRRIDWTDDFISNDGIAYLFEGKMEGYIRNLNTEKLWKYRPYYEAKSGKRYYGEWKGIDPTNTSYFEPTVHTYAQQKVEGNTAQISGYVMRGSDNTIQQGFKYWKDASETRGLIRNIANVPKDAIIIEATGVLIEACLSELDSNSIYSYVAFVTTTEGETFYGEQQSFQTGERPTIIEPLPAEQNRNFVRIYGINGQLLSIQQEANYWKTLQGLKSGLYIVSDGRKTWKLKKD